MRLETSDNFTIDDHGLARLDPVTLLSALIIGGMPVGLNRSSTMAVRIESRGVEPIAKEALMMLSQGIGRAVRSADAAQKYLEG